ncbi:A/G-specific adenine glycosylase [candidate division KSB1 bacterium]|nr:A/G-specific adenine glycosylase [candidate division KSB1 bacterium]
MNIDKSFEGTFLSQFKRKLLKWYDQNGRDLPWRRTTNPYHIWLSEVMLQQTQVQTVIPYFERWLQAMPDIRHVAQTSLDRILKLWEGLGYYARARNFHKAARIVVDKFGGDLPDSYPELAALPGFGPYTTAAVLSIAFNRNYAVLDGNVIRVLCRILNIDSDVNLPETKRSLARHAQVLLDTKRPGDFNQAIMELGAVICAPGIPACKNCPVRSHCLAYREGDPSRLPVKARKEPVPHHDVAAGIILKDSRILIAQRNHNDMLGGLWEFPGGKRERDETLEECLVREIKEELAIEIQVDEKFMVLRHAYTHFKITLHVFLCRYLGGMPKALECADWRWVMSGELSNFAFSRADQKVLEKFISTLAND